MTPPTPRRSSAADGNAKAKRYMLVVPNGTADLGDLRAMPTNPCTAAHNQVNAVTEGPHTPCQVGCGTVAVPHTGRTAQPAPPPAVPLRGHVEPAARIPPMHSAWSKERASAVRPPYRVEALRHDPLPRRSALARSEHSPTRRERAARCIIFLACH